MKKLFVLLIPIIIAGALFFGFQYIASSQVSIAALQVTSTPAAEVFLDNVSMGKTPLSNDKLTPGEHTLKLVPQGSSGLFNFEEKITLGQSVLTVVDRIFKSTEAESETSMLSLEPINQKNEAEISVVSSPDGAQIKLDDQPQDVTPTVLRGITVSDHEITVSKEGYNSKTLRVRTAQGYRLTISTKLSIQRASSEPKPPASEDPKEASMSAIVEIEETPTGFLRVREKASIASREIARVNPGETFELLDEQEGWYKIMFDEDKEGWISSQYAAKKP